MRPEVLLLGEMIDAAEQAQSLVAGVDLQELEVDRLRRDALLWNFTVLGEASTQLDEAFKSQFPNVDWARPAQLRNRIVHGYWSVDLEILHTTATDLLPSYVEELRKVLAGSETPTGD